MNRAKHEKRIKQIKHLEAKVERIQVIIQKLKLEAKAFEPNKTTLDVSIMDTKRTANKETATTLQLQQLQEIQVIIQRLNSEGKSLMPNKTTLDKEE